MLVFANLNFLGEYPNPWFLVVLGLTDLYLSISLFLLMARRARAMRARRFAKFVTAAGFVQALAWLGPLVSTMSGNYGGEQSNTLGWLLTAFTTCAATAVVVVFIIKLNSVGRKVLGGVPAPSP